MNTVFVEYPQDWKDYALIDSGDGEKLERFGDVTIARPDPRILWEKKAPKTVWDNADAQFIRTSATDGTWTIKRQPPIPWTISYNHLSFLLKPTEFKHVGIFPEQAVNWQWCAEQIQGTNLSVLNLFGYTGAASLAAAAAGAQVTHVDSSKGTIAWARDNAKASGLDTKPIRWIEDDAYKFVCREGRREAHYDGIILDPPRFGRGAKGEIWKLETHLPKLLIACKAILSKSPKFILINAYTADLSSLVLHHLLADMTNNLEGTITFGELALQESYGKRLLPHGIFARWQSA